MRDAAAVTVITEELNEFNFAGRPSHLMRPGVDTERFSPDVEPATTRRRLGIDPDEFLLVYQGAMHRANEREMFSLYLAVSLLRRRGHRVRLVRLGEDWSHGLDPSIGALRDRGVIELGAVPWRDVPGYLVLATAFVQPGARRLQPLPPAVEAAGVPGHGQAGDPAAVQHRRGARAGRPGPGARPRRWSRDRRPARVPDQGSELARRLGRAAREFALTNLDWERNAARLADFYRRIVTTSNGEGPKTRRPLGRLRARAAELVRVARYRDIGAADTPFRGGMSENRSRALVPDDALWRVTERYRGDSSSRRCRTGRSATSPTAAPSCRACRPPTAT